MSVPLDAVGRELDGHETYVDARWTMSYAAVSGQKLPLSPAIMDTSPTSSAELLPTFDFHGRGMQGVGSLTHPLFVWAVEWPISWSKSAPLWEGQVANGMGGVHYSQDIVIHRPIVAGDTLMTHTQVIGVEQRPNGAVTTTKFVTTDARTGDPVVTTWQGSYLRGVRTDPEVAVGSGRYLDEFPPPQPLPPDLDGAASAAGTATEGAPVAVVQIPISQVEAHLYSECARIWNPIHTDKAAAKAAGLPDIILHGTATLAKAVSSIIDTYAGGDPSRVTRLACSAFSAMVLMPSVIELHVHR
jgi:acyl dehydratase